MQKGQKTPSTEGVKTGIALLDNALLVFNNFFDKLGKDPKAFFIIILIASNVFTGYKYIKEAENADVRVEKKQLECEEKVENLAAAYNERILKLETIIKNLQDNAVIAEKEYNKGQKALSDRADAIVDKLLKISKK